MTLFKLCILLIALLCCASSLPFTQGSESNASWMGDMLSRIGNSTLLDITLPGTHDTGAYELFDEFGPGTNAELNMIVEIAAKFGIPAFKIIREWALAQNFTLYEQLYNGARYFDMRNCFDAKNNEFRTCHMILGNPISKILQDIRRFLDEFPTEIIFIEASNFAGSSTENRTFLAELYESTFQGLMYPRSDNFQSTINQMLSNNWRVLISFDDVDVVAARPNLWFANTTEGVYSNQDILSNMVSFNIDSVGKNGGNHKMFEVWWTLTEQASDIEKSILDPFDHVTSLKLLARIANWGMQDFFNFNLTSRMNILIFDHLEEAFGVELAKKLNYIGCNDDVAYRAANFCRAWAANGNCTDPAYAEFMSTHCPFSCKACVEPPGLIGAECLSNTDCVSKSCIVSQYSALLGTCGIEQPKAVGDSCGNDLQCWSGKCGRSNNICIGRAINAVCTRNEQCGSNNCTNGLCQGLTLYKWIGAAPECKPQSSECVDDPTGYILLPVSSTCGDGDACLSGEKYLCVSDLSYERYSFFWHGTAPVCNASPTDCMKTDSEFVLSNKCGDGDECLPIVEQTNKKVLCRRRT